MIDNFFDAMEAWEKRKKKFLFTTKLPDRSGLGFGVIPSGWTKTGYSRIGSRIPDRSQLGRTVSFKFTYGNDCCPSPEGNILILCYIARSVPVFVRVLRHYIKTSSCNQLNLDFKSILPLSCVDDRSAPQHKSDC